MNLNPNNSNPNLKFISKQFKSNLILFNPNPFLNPTQIYFKLYFKILFITRFNTPLIKFKNQIILLR